jgi:hypothetical protein
MSPEFDLDAGRPKAVRVGDGGTYFGQHHVRATSCEQLGGRDAAARGADNHHAAPLNREIRMTHTITAASTSSG